MIEKEIPYNYICIEGNIGSGKTTFCEMMAKTNNCSLILEEFDDNPFLPMFYGDPEKFAFTVELFFMTERHKQMSRIMSVRNMFDDFILGDYFFLKTLLFARKNLSEEEYKLFNKIFQVLDANLPQPELVIYFHRDVNILRQNIDKRGRSYEVGITKEYLKQIQDSYFDYFRNVLSYPVLILDLKDIDFVDNKDLFKYLQSLLKKKYQPGVHRISINI
jgi:deoxyadenosine/deoxycytidine kinase